MTAANVQMIMQHKRARREVGDEGQAAGSVCAGRDGCARYAGGLSIDQRSVNRSEDLRVASTNSQAEYQCCQKNNVPCRHPALRVGAAQSLAGRQAALDSRR